MFPAVYAQLALLSLLLRLLCRTCRRQLPPYTLLNAVTFISFAFFIELVAEGSFKEPSRPNVGTAKARFLAFSEIPLPLR